MVLTRCSAKDLIRKLLVVSPDRRLVAADCLKHPWVTAGQVSSDPLTEARSKMQVRAACQAWWTHTTVGM